MSQADWDVFFSYPRADYPLAEPLITALEAKGLRTFVDHNHVRDFSSISDTLSKGLARSTLLLAFYSERYLYRRSCNFELTAAFVAGQREGDPCQRIAVVNPHTTFDHVHPTDLRDRRSLALFDYNDRLHDLAAIVAERVRSIGGTIGDPPDAAATLWYPPPPPVGSTDTQPFRAELWAAHSALRPGAAAYHTGAWEGGTARVCALDQDTATAFAQDYALQFSASYPGGIYWFPLRGRSGDALSAAFSRDLSTVCALLDIGDSGHTGVEARLADIASHLERVDGPSLWILDGLRGPDAHETLRRLRNPHSRGATLVTGEVSRTDGPGSLIDITVPDPGAARPVLLRGAPPVVGSHPGQEAFVDRIVRQVGGHPTALRAARRLLSTADPPSLAYELVHERLNDPGEDVLAFDARYARLLDDLEHYVRTLSDAARAAVIWVALSENRSASTEVVMRALAFLREGRAGGAGVVAGLGEAPYVRLAAGRLRVHPLMARAVRYRLTDPGLVEDLTRLWEKASD